MGFSKIFQDLVDRKERAEQGKYNCLPLPFLRFKNYFPGIEQGKYLIITANQKIGKSKFADYLFVYEPIFFGIEHPEFHFKVIYFTLEMSPKAKYLEFLSHLLWRLDNKIVSPTQLRSVDNQHPISQDILDLLQSETYQRYIDFYEKHIEYFAESSNPTGLRKVVRAYADKHGHYNYVEYTSVDEVTGKETKNHRLDPDKPYTADDESEYVFVITDNAANISVEKGMSQKEAIEKWSKDYIAFRDQLNYIPVLIQHQAQSQEGVENRKLNMVIPSSSGLAVSKTTANDGSLLIGLYNPFKYGFSEYEGYDLKRLRDYARFMVVCEDREYGAGNNVCPLFFNGASSVFLELPKPDDKAGMNGVYDYIDILEKKKIDKTYLFKSKIKKFTNKILNFKLWQTS